MIFLLWMTDAGVIDVFDLRLKSPSESSGGSELKPSHSIERPSGIQRGTFGAALPGNAHLATGDFAGGLHVVCVERYFAL